MAPRPTASRSHVAGQVVRSGRVTKGKSEKTPANKVPSDQIKVVSTDQVLEQVHGEPPAWAENRQQLCDAIPWFHCTQGAMYHSEGFCWGFLIDADGGTRTYIDDEIIITRIGGCCTKDSEGNLALQKNQEADSTLARSIIASLNSKLPVGLIIGSKHKILNRDLPHRYNVMAWFRVTNVWFERIGTNHGAKVRFEKLDLAEKSWWAAKGSAPPMPLELRDFDTKPQTLKCEGCSKESIRVYEDGWMCLQPECDRFWKIGNVSSPPELTFNPAFLSFRSRPDNEIRPNCSLVPDHLSTLNEDATDVSTSRGAWKGIVCPECHKCIRRTLWRGWKCSDDSTGTQTGGNVCSFERLMTMNPISRQVLLDDSEQPSMRREMVFDRKFMIPEIDDVSLSPYRKLTYKLDGVGFITHLVANAEINSRPNGSDDLFIGLQREDLGLKRFPLSSSLVAGTLTAHFAVNHGSPYKYVVSVLSKAFGEAPGIILRALGRLSWATEQAVISAGDMYMPPNELLTLGYFEGMKIGYHDDGESSLGPTIATLSLGAKSTMWIRMKYKHFNGHTRRVDAGDGKAVSGSVLQEDPVLKGCRLEDERRALKERFGAGEISQDEYDNSRRTLFAIQKGKQAPPAIKLELHHGDLVVMHGENLQRYYEHSVVPENKLRFALTARYVKPDHVDAAEIEKGNFTLTPDQIYDGK
ncbi:Oxoglutarate/iron-dependent dioxygenase [Penicillium bovifimosum]|uniref:Oxoglutarate/iron-dependent dioxygenase n=1 Tax=Penicillium bovifimosum TaxID=126998 RepID=A0A9W9H556_9EURO|nr:Oxoglutarate/iron-dependent dioxygenase [Penicillium bovifimosum]KAJ5138753.1 Oxoglutarate/iron-dependent dioxygenase [Penicillium bovifimosum]